MKTDPNIHGLIGFLIGAVGTLVFCLMVILPFAEASTTNRMNRGLIQYELQCEKERREYCGVVVKDIRERTYTPQR